MKKFVAVNVYYRNGHYVGGGWCAADEIESFVKMINCNNKKVEVKIVSARPCYEAIDLNSDFYGTIFAYVNGKQQRVKVQ